VELDMEALEAVVTSKTRAMVICNPANPSGKVYTRDELEADRSILPSNTI
jgi:aspartate/methionine/tyrosine aminotransferase